MSASTESRQYRPAGRMEALLDRSTESSSRITTLGPVQTDQNSSLHLHPRTLLTHNRHSTVSSQRCPQKGQQLTSQSLTSSPRKMSPPFYSSYSVAARRGRAWSLGRTDLVTSTRYKLSPEMVPTGKNAINVASTALAKAQALQARKENDAMVYLDGAQIYTCGQCRTHLTSHDDIISKSFHGHHGRAYLFDQCVNVNIGKPEDRMLMTGLHSVCDISCKRCKTLVGWTYIKCYEPSQRYKERKYIIEKVFIHMEDNPNYDGIPTPAGEKADRWRRRSMSWGTDSSASSQTSLGSRTIDMVYEYHQSVPSTDEKSPW